jgi:hypothetical protein
VCGISKAHNKTNEMKQTFLGNVQNKIFGVALKANKSYENYL